MLWHPQDAEDAAQEILVKVATRLSTFRGDAQVTTWVHRIAVNHLLTTRRRRAEDPTLTFAAFGEDLTRDLDAAYDPRHVDDELLAQEVMVGCTQALLCLDREHPMAYILGDVLELTSEHAAALCGIAPAAFRKRLQRARERIQHFMQGHCGLLDPTNPCRCRRRVGAAIRRGRVDPEDLLFAQRVDALKLDMQGFTDAGAIFRSQPRAAHTATARRRSPARRQLTGAAARSMIALSRSRSFRLARRIAAATIGAESFAKPAGSPRLRRNIRVARSPASSHA
jgi:RNA polymerase sigma factor (sigma-70 family)